MNGTRDGDEGAKVGVSGRGHNGPVVAFQVTGPDTKVVAQGAGSEDGDDPNKGVKTVKSFRELKAIYESKSAADKKGMDAVPAKAVAALAKRFASPAVSSGPSVASSSSPSNRISPSSSPKTWKKDARLPPSEESSPTSTHSSSSGASPVSSLSASYAQPSRRDPEPSAISLRCSSGADASKAMNSPRSGGGERTKARSPNPSPSAPRAAANESLSKSLSSSEGEVTTSAGMPAEGGVGNSWLKKVTGQKPAADGDIDGGRSGRALSIAIEKGKVASVKEKFLEAGGASTTASSTSATKSSKNDHPSITDRGRVSSSDFKELSRETREREREREREKEHSASVAAKGASKSTEDLTDDDDHPRHGSTHSRGSGIMRGSARHSSSHHSSSHHSRSNSANKVIGAPNKDALFSSLDTNLSPKHASSDGATEGAGATSSKGSDDGLKAGVARSEDGLKSEKVGRPKSSPPVAEEEPLPSWALRWQHRLQEKEREREMKKEKEREERRSAEAAARADKTAKEKEPAAPAKASAPPPSDSHVVKREAVVATEPAVAVASIGEATEAHRKADGKSERKESAKRDGHRESSSSSTSKARKEERVKDTEKESLPKPRKEMEREKDDASKTDKAAKDAAAGSKATEKEPKSEAKTKEERTKVVVTAPLPAVAGGEETTTEADKDGTAPPPKAAAHPADADSAKVQATEQSEKDGEPKLKPESGRGERAKSVERKEAAPSQALRAESGAEASELNVHNRIAEGEVTRALTAATAEAQPRPVRRNTDADGRARRNSRVIERDNSAERGLTASSSAPGTPEKERRERCFSVEGHKGHPTITAPGSSGNLRRTSLAAPSEKKEAEDKPAREERREERHGHSSLQRHKTTGLPTGARSADAATEQKQKDDTPALPRRKENEARLSDRDRVNRDQEREKKEKEKDKEREKDGRESRHGKEREKESSREDRERDRDKDRERDKERRPKGESRTAAPVVVAATTCKTSQGEARQKNDSRTTDDSRRARGGTSKKDDLSSSSASSSLAFKRTDRTPSTSGKREAGGTKDNVDTTADSYASREKRKERGAFSEKRRDRRASVTLGGEAETTWTSSSLSASSSKGGASAKPVRLALNTEGVKNASSSSSSKKASASQPRTPRGSKRATGDRSKGEKEKEKDKGKDRTRHETEEEESGEEKEATTKKPRSGSEGEVTSLKADQAAIESDNDDDKESEDEPPVEDADDDHPPEILTPKDPPAMKKFFVDFMNQYKENIGKAEKASGNKAVIDGRRSKTRTKLGAGAGGGHKALHARSRERLGGLDLEMSKEAQARYAYRDSIGSKSEIDEHLTETEATAVSEWESETECGTETEIELDTETETEELSDREEELAPDRNERQLALNNLAASAVPRKKRPASTDERSARKEEATKESPTLAGAAVVSAASASASPAAASPPHAVDKKLIAQRKDPGELSSSPAAALFGSPKQRRKDPRYSGLFGGSSKSDDRKPKTSQSRRAVTAFLSRTSSHSADIRKAASQQTSSPPLAQQQQPPQARPRTSGSSSGSSSPRTSASPDSSPGHSPVPSPSSSHRGSLSSAVDTNSSSSSDNGAPLAVGQREGADAGGEEGGSGGGGEEESGGVAVESAAVNKKGGSLIEKAKTKRLTFDEGVRLFNESSKPHRAMRLLIANGFVREDPEDIARFLHSANNSLDKEQLGILLAENEDIFPEVLVSFIDQMDFHMYDFDIALRKLLFTFRLPGEAQKIDRIVKVWAAHWHDHNPGVLPEMKCAYVLAYAAIMLNTDAHNEMVRYKMSLKEFLVNVTYNDGGELIPPAFLEEIYPRIVEEEIKMEDDGALFPTASKKGWLQVRSRKPFNVWKRRWVLLTSDKLHILRKIGDQHPLQSISLENLLMNTPIKDQGKKFLLFLYHAPTQETNRTNRSQSDKTSTNGGSLKDRRLQEGDRVGTDGERPERRGKGGTEPLDLNDRVVTVLCAHEKEVFDGWVASITKYIGIKSRLKKVCSTRF